MKERFVDSGLVVEEGLKGGNVFMLYRRTNTPIVVLKPFAEQKRDDRRLVILDSSIKGCLQLRFPHAPQVLKHVSHIIELAMDTRSTKPLDYIRIDVRHLIHMRVLLMQATRKNYDGGEIQNKGKTETAIFSPRWQRPFQPRGKEKRPPHSAAARPRKSPDANRLSHVSAYMPQSSTSSKSLTINATYNATTNRHCQTAPT